MPHSDARATATAMTTTTATTTTTTTTTTTRGARARARGVARARDARGRWRRATVPRARATSDADDDDANAPREATRAMSYDDGTPLIDVASVRVKRTTNKSAAPPVTRPGVLKSRAATLREIDEAARGDEDDATEDEATMEADEAWTRRKRRESERVELTSSASVMEWMVRTTDDMLDDVEAREPPGAVAAWALTKRAESVVENPAVKKTVDIVGKASVAAVRAAAPVVVDGAGKMVKEGSKLAVKAAVSAATAKGKIDRREREKEASKPFGGLLGGGKKTTPLVSEAGKKKNPFAFPALAKKPEPEPPRGLFGRKKEDAPKRGFFGRK